MAAQGSVPDLKQEATTDLFYCTATVTSNIRLHSVWCPSIVCMLHAGFGMGNTIHVARLLATICAMTGLSWWCILKQENVWKMNFMKQVWTSEGSALDGVRVRVRRLSLLRRSHRRRREQGGRGIQARRREPPRTHEHRRVRPAPRPRSAVRVVRRRHHGGGGGAGGDGDAVGLHGGLRGAGGERGGGVRREGVRGPLVRCEEVEHAAEGGGGGGGPAAVELATPTHPPRHTSHRTPRITRVKCHKLEGTCDKNKGA